MADASVRKKTTINQRADTGRSLGELVYQEVLRAIREGEYHPGDRIIESRLTQKLDVSRTPVREALQRLQSEGRLVSEPNRGVFVAELDYQEVAELYAVRQHIEGTAARFAARQATKAEIENMFHILERSREHEADARQLNQVNWDLHHAIYNAAHNRFLTRSINAIGDDMALLRGARYIPEDRAAELYEEHLAILRAIADRDPDSADQAAQAHIENAFRMHLRTAFEMNV